jgi:hypothetical protein
MEMHVRRFLGLLLVAIAVAACGAAASPSPSAPSPSALSPSPDGFGLRPAPADLGCDAIRPPYDEVTFRIDPSAEDAVTAVTDTGTVLKTYWSSGFRGGTTADPVVRDAAGQVVVRDGDVMVIPEAEWPSVAGYFVCPSTDAVYVLERGPA